ncbi:VOC family protein [Streptomyces sp. NPDC090306]|uniref:VOC family protein n=1 Tax=Streptomyces sp. NPDC090306 TaxID=3365961 RepID=UPI0038294193
MPHDEHDGQAAVPALSPDALFHTGLVVDDLDLAMKTFGALAGYHFTTVMELEVTARLADGRLQHASQRFALTVEEPRLELVEAIPGTVWVSDGSNGAHHLGYWADSDRIGAMSAELVAQGFAVEASNDHEADGILMWVYHRGLGGLRIELLNKLMKPSMDAWIAGADPAEVAQEAPGS